MPDHFKDIPMKFIIDALTQRILEEFFPLTSAMEAHTIHAKIDKMMWEVKDEVEYKRKLNDV